MNTITPDETVERLIREEEIRMLYGNAKLLAAGTFLTSTIYIFAVYQSAESTLGLVIWYTALSLITLARLWDYYCYNRATSKVKSDKKWGHRFLLGSTSAGICWGLMAWLGFSADYVYQVMAAIFIVGVTGTAMSTLSYRWETISLFLITSLSLIGFRMMVESTSFSKILLYLIILYVVISLVSSRRFYINANSNIRLRIEADLREEYLLELKNDAEHASKAKSEFLSSMSHELRTPLNAILGFTQLMQYDVRLIDRHKKQLLEITHAGKHLLNLVNQILDLARIEGRGSRLMMEKIDAEAIMLDCVALTQSLADKQNITLDVRFERSPVIDADHMALKQVFLNLLSNAIKYNVPNGTVQIDCEDAGDGRLCINFRDSGVGIDQSRVREIFEPFNRLDAGDKGVDGTGIGLSITRDLVEQMNGEITAESLPDEGSLFRLKFDGELRDRPAHNRDTDDDVDTPPEITHIVPPRGKILVVEDNNTNQDLLKLQLETLGYSCDIASNGKVALEMFSNDQYMLVLTDCNMPVMNGYQLARTIRAGDAAIPIIGITADAFPDSEEKCIKAGMSGRITKPVELLTLQNMLETKLQAA